MSEGKKKGSGKIKGSDPLSCSMRLPELFRVHIRPGGGLAGAILSFNYCLREQVLGLGWQVEFPPGSDRNWDTYESLAVKQYGTSDLSRVRFLHDNLQPNDLIWTRDPHGKYYLAKTISFWEYHEAPGRREKCVRNHCSS